jgi:hypothetical protein
MRKLFGIILIGIGILLLADGLVKLLHLIWS